MNRQGKVELGCLVMSAVVIAIVFIIVGGVSRSLYEKYTDAGRRKAAARRAAQHRNISGSSRERCERCLQTVSTWHFCAICGCVCGECLPACYDSHPSSIR